MAEEISPLENHGWWMEQLRKDAKANRPEALRLADQLIAYLGGNTAAQAADELRRLHHNNQVLKDALWRACGDDEEAVNATIACEGELK
jgi:hypothetical protein